ncbi:MAG: hypothetical protein ACJA2E_000417 [Arenicella sp.]|jgi:hypothetical protein
MPKFFRNVVGLIAATLATSVVGSIFSTQSVITSLQSLEIDVSLATRLSMTIDDFAILPSLAPVTAVCFVIGFIVAALCVRYIGGNRTAWHILAGAAALITTLLIMKAVLLITAIAGTRTIMGLMSFGLAGAIGGWVYAKITTRKETA